MNGLEASKLAGYLGRLYPRWKPTKELTALWLKQLAAHDYETARRSIEKLRVASAYDEPSLHEYESIYRSLRSESPPAPSYIKALESRPGAMSAKERAIRYSAENGYELWIADGNSERHWPAMQAIIDQYLATGVASHATGVLALLRQNETTQEREKRWKEIINQINAKKAAIEESDGERKTPAAGKRASRKPIRETRP